MRHASAFHLATNSLARERSATGMSLLLTALPAPVGYEVAW